MPPSRTEVIAYIRRTLDRHLAYEHRQTEHYPSDEYGAILPAGEFLSPKGVFTDGDYSVSSTHIKDLHQAVSLILTILEQERSSTPPAPPPFTRSAVVSAAPILVPKQDRYLLFAVAMALLAGVTVGISVTLIAITL
jgi:hypothetical protein